MVSLKLMLCSSGLSQVVQTGVTELKSALDEKKIPFQFVPSIAPERKDGEWMVVLGTAADYQVKVLLEGSGRHMPPAPESLGCFRLRGREGEIVLLAGADETGLMYLLLETARKIRLYGAEAIENAKEYTESPENQVRCMDRYLLGHLDNEWYLSEEFWQYYFKRLANTRFNRFCLILGFDTAYMSPPYPFFLPVKGYEQVGLTDRVTTSREENLNALRRIVDLCHQYGMRFTLATWQQRPWTTAQESLVKGLPESERELSEYCYSGIIALLEAVPGIDIVQFRVNHESGVGTQVSAEDFWNHCTDAVAEAGKQAGKRFTLDLRAKGLTESMVDHAQALGLDVEVPTKYWCEHAALPYHLSIMRSEELAQLQNYNHSRRYSYADMLKKPKKYDVIFRLWNYGSTNLFLWGDADYARRFAKSCSLSGSTGFQVNAPLSLKYGHELSHQHAWKIFRDESLNQAEWEEERFWLWYTLYGRIGYNTKADAEIWESEFEKRFGKKQGVLFQQALVSASRIVPLITTVHMPVHPSLRYWTELNTGWALFAENNLNKMTTYDFYKSITYGSSEPSDHGLFYGIDEYAHDVYADQKAQGKYTPLQYAAWLEDLAAETARLTAGLLAEGGQQEEIRAACLDMEMVSHLGMYHAQKIRSAYALACFRETGDASFLPSCHAFLAQAIGSWQALADLGKREYYHDLDFSSAGSTTRRGTWGDLTKELERDLQSVLALLAENGIAASANEAPAHKMPPCKAVEIAADFPEKAQAGQAVVICAAIAGLKVCPEAPVLHYRQVNQLAGEFQTVRMEKAGEEYCAKIPVDQVTGSWDLMAYVTLQQPGQACAMCPGISHPKYPFPYAVIETI